MVLILAGVAFAVADRQLEADLRRCKRAVNNEADNNGRNPISENLSGSHCLEAFDVADGTIVRANESVENGAQYLDIQMAETFEVKTQRSVFL